MNIQDNIQRYNRNPELSDWFQDKLKDLVSYGVYHNNISDLSRIIIGNLAKYKVQHNIDQVVIGISGGIDSAVTASLFKNAGWNVTGVLLPIHQDPVETQRGEELCKTLGIDYKEIDLTTPFDQMVDFYKDTDVDFNNELVDDNMKQQQIGRAHI